MDDGGTANGGVDLSIADANIQLLIATSEAQPETPTASVNHFSIAENATAGSSVGVVDVTVTDPLFTQLDQGSFADASHSLPDVNRYAANGDYLGDTIGQWQVVAGSVDLHGSFWGRGPAGGLALELNGSEPGTVIQSFDTVVGSRYNLSFALSGDFRAASSETVQMLVDTGNISNIVRVNMPDEWSEQSPQWRQETVSFVATEPVTTLQLQSLTPGGSGALIADIEVRDDVRFELLSTTSPFAIDEAGKVTVADTTLDFETQQSYLIEAVANAAEGKQSALSLQIDLTDVNESPVLHNQRQPQLVIGDTVVIDATHLAATDVDELHQSPDTDLYVIDKLPTDGSLSVDSEELLVGDSFSQADLNSGRVSYTHTGVTASIDQFEFTLTDVDGSADNASDELLIEIRDPLIITTLSEWTLLEQGSLTLTSDHIDHNGGFVDDTDLLVVLTRQPETTMVADAATGGPLDEFTLQDLQDGNVELQHDGTEPRADSLELSIFRTDAQNPLLLESSTVVLTILDVADAPSATDSTLATDQLTALTISDEQPGFSDGDDGDSLAAIRIVEVPESGTLQLNGVAIGANRTVPVSALKSDMLQYVPDSSATEVHTVDIVFTVVDDGNLDNGGSNESQPFSIQIEVSNLELAAANENQATDVEDLFIELAPQVQPETSDTGTGVLGSASALSSTVSVTGNQNPAPQSEGDSSGNDEPAFEFAEDNEARQTRTADFRDVVVQHASTRQVERAVDDADTESEQGAVIISFNSTDINAVYEGRLPKSIQSLAQELNNIKSQVNGTEIRVFQIGTLTFSASLSLGFALWILRSGLFLSTVMATVPSWRMLDPLPVLDGVDGEDEDDSSESLESMVRHQQTADPEGHTEDESEVTNVAEQKR